jgi:WD40 repeat protein
VLDRRGNTKDQLMTLLLDSNGAEIKLSGTNSGLVPDAVNPAWLGDGSTLAYLVEQQKNPQRFAIYTVRPAAGAPLRMFADAQFLDVTWIHKSSQAVAVRAGTQFGARPRLVFLDLAKQESRELVPLDGFSAGLSISPSGKLVAYFRDPEHFEVRALADPQQARALKLLTGAYYWSQDETRILLKSAPARKSGTLRWIRLSDGNERDIFHGLAIHEASISPDGQLLGILSPGKRTLNVYPLAGVE